MNFYKAMMVTSIFLIPTTVFSSEQAAHEESDSFGYYELDIGDYSKPKHHYSLPKKGVGTIQVKQNGVFSITFPANATTGYSWALRALPEELMLVDSNYRNADECKGRKVGCNGFTTYTFKALEKGTGVAKFLYGRPWERDESSVRVVNINVE